MTLKNITGNGKHSCKIHLQNQKKKHHEKRKLNVYIIKKYTQISSPLFSHTGYYLHILSRISLMENFLKQLHNGISSTPNVSE